jgi:hypothetical protein
MVRGMIKRTDCVGLILGSLLMTLGCSTASTPATNPEAVRQHADKAFQQLNAQEHSQQHSDPHASPQAAALGDTTTMPLPSIQQRGQIPSAEIGSSDGEYIRATGYGNLAKGFYLCQHSADLAARVELSKLAHVTVTERSTDRIRERTGKEAEQDIEVVREGLVNEVLRDVRIVDRSVSKEAGTCSSTAMISKRNLFSTPAGSDARPSGPQ